jgi:hypothetical protein
MGGEMKRRGRRVHKRVQEGLVAAMSRRAKKLKEALYVAVLTVAVGMACGAEPTGGLTSPFFA